jgi:hypothetical protein
MMIEHKSELTEGILKSTAPVLLRGLVSHWPAVQAGLKSNQDFRDYILEFDTKAPLTVYHGHAEIKGRLFYNTDFTGFNFSRNRKPLTSVLDAIFSESGKVDPETYYVGSTLISHWLPGFEQQNTIDLGGRAHLNSIWLGNQSVIAPHFDFPTNIACAVAGRRRVTLFPPEQTDNLYIGPFELTPSGQPISLVDLRSPDFLAFPKFKKAQASSITVDLEAGDAILIPSMWWHSVEALCDFNVLVNYWWRTTPSYLGSPLAALQHALISFDQLPPEQLSAWKALFDRYVFERNSGVTEHIPEHIRGVLSGVDEKTAIQMRLAIAKSLKT